MKIKSNFSEYTPENCVQVWDNIHPELLPQMDKLSRQHKWAFFIKSDAKDPTTSWAIDIQGGATDGTMSDGQLVENMKKNWGRVSKEYPFVPILWNTIKKLIPDHCLDLKRVFINGQTYGLGGGIHYDSVVPGITFVYYLNKRWHPEWGGHTLIYRHNGEECTLLGAVEPKPARLIAFDARLNHKGDAPSRECKDLRCTLAFHTRIRENKDAK